MSSGRGSRLVVLMGVAGSGKTTIGERLASAEGWGFLDADDLHRPEDRERMESGTPIADDARAAWIGRVHDAVAVRLAAGGALVLACSALRAEHRRTLADGPWTTTWVDLRVPVAELERRLRERSHGVGPDLLASQLAAMEVPEDAIAVDATRSVDAVVADVARQVAMAGGS